MNLNNNFGAALRDYLKTRGITQLWLAKQLGVSTANVSSYLKTKEPFHYTKTKILEALGITEEELFGVEKKEIKEYVPKKVYDEILYERNLLLEEVAEYRKQKIIILEAERQGVTP